MPRDRSVWKACPVNSFVRMSISAGIAVVAVAACSPAAVAPSPVVSRAAVAPSAPAPSSAVPSPSPSASAEVGSLDTATWQTYTSARYGFSIGHPAGWAEVPSDRAWTQADDADWLNTAAESFTAPGQTVRASAWSEPVKPGTSLDTWIQSYCTMNTSPCTDIKSRSQAVTMDADSGVLVQFSGDTQAFFLVGDRVYAVVVWEDDADPRTGPYGGAVRLLKGYLSTVRLLPGGPASPAPSVSPRPS